MTIIGVVSDKVITANAHSLCRLRDQLDRRATFGRASIGCGTCEWQVVILVLRKWRHGRTSFGK